MKFSVPALLACVATLLAATSASAKTFRNAYVSFELPNNRWGCILEQTEFVCRTTDTNIDAREAIIVLTAKEVGPNDALTSYEQHLKAPRSIPSRSGVATQSQVYKVEQRNIANHAWVDGLHFASEVPNYYTRYLATTKEKIAILVTFSAHKLKYSKYAGDLSKLIQSLRVTATTASMKTGFGGGDGSNGGPFGGPTNADVGGDMNGEALPEEGTGGGGGPGATEMFAGALILAAIGFYLLAKKRKK